MSAVIKFSSGSVHVSALRLRQNRRRHASRLRGHFGFGLKEIQKITLKILKRYNDCHGGFPYEIKGCQMFWKCPNERKSIHL